MSTVNNKFMMAWHRIKFVCDLNVFTIDQRFGKLIAIYIYTIGRVAINVRIVSQDLCGLLT